MGGSKQEISLLVQMTGSLASWIAKKNSSSIRVSKVSHRFLLISLVKSAFEVFTYTACFISLVPPADLEAVLLQHPDVSDSGVIGVYSEKDATELPRYFPIFITNF
jgi:hypothetical protein